MAKEVWIVEGIGDDNPSKYQIKSNETIGDLKNQFATKLGVSAREIEISTDTKRLTNENANVSSMVNDGDTLHVIPRAKAGNF
jgi:hypothetical protein